MKIGIIGMGNIGEMLAKRFSESLRPSDIFVFDANKRRTGKYSRAGSSQEIIDRSELVFVCIKPQNLSDFLSGIKPRNKIFVTTVAAINENTYYKYLGKQKLVRIIPSMINKKGGPILMAAGKYSKRTDKNKVEKLLSKIGSVYEIKESEIDAYTHLSSCSPAIIAEFLRLYLGAIIKKKKIKKQKALKVLLETLEILVPLLKKEGFKIIPQVATKGGITEQGIKIMASHQRDFFEELTGSMLKRMSDVKKQYGK